MNLINRQYLMHPPSHLPHPQEGTLGFLDMFGGRKAALKLADDLDALQQMRLKHGDNTRAELERRASDRGLNGRDRRHWQRLLTLAEEDNI